MSGFGDLSLTLRPQQNRAKESVNQSSWLSLTLLVAVRNPERIATLIAIEIMAASGDFDSRLYDELNELIDFHPEMYNNVEIHRQHTLTCLS